MCTGFEIDLLNAVETFKTVAEMLFPNITEENDNGEWEHELEEFDDMISAGIAVIQNLSVSEASEQTKDLLLYAIARDNECNNIIEEILNHSKWFAELCKKVLDTNYVNAKWQFAELLGKCDSDNSINNLIFDFLSCGHEYTERMALKSLANIHPEKAEEYAILFWEREKYECNEYQKIMALYVLHKIKSPSLECYLRKSEALNSPLLTHEINRIKQEKN